VVGVKVKVLLYPRLVTSSVRGSSPWHIALALESSQSIRVILKTR